MSDFVEQCRDEWKRLGVPDPLAEEMATDLAADLREAAAEGVSAEELLGDSAFDPPAFAAAWAAERGIVPAPQGGPDRRRPLFLVVFTVVAAIALVVSAALLATGEPKLTIRSYRFSGPTKIAGPVHSASAATPIEWILLVVALVALGFAVRMWSQRRRSQPPVAHV